MATTLINIKLSSELKKTKQNKTKRLLIYTLPLRGIISINVRIEIEGSAKGILY